MTLEALKKICQSLPSTWDFPFDDETLVFRVGNRIFALCGIRNTPLRVNLKCEPSLARDLRLAYPDITPGWHMNKEHWNTVNLEGALDQVFVEALVRHSYDRVKEGLPKAVQASLDGSRSHLTGNRVTNSLPN